MVEKIRQVAVKRRTCILGRDLRHLAAELWGNSDNAPCKEISASNAQTHTKEHPHSGSTICVIWNWWVLKLLKRVWMKFRKAKIRHTLYEHTKHRKHYEGKSVLSTYSKKMTEKATQWKTNTLTQNQKHCTLLWEILEAKGKHMEFKMWNICYLDLLSLRHLPPAKYSRSARSSRPLHTTLTGLPFCLFSSTSISSAWLASSCCSAATISSSKCLHACARESRARRVKAITHLGIQAETNSAQVRNL